MNRTIQKLSGQPLLNRTRRFFNEFSFGEMKKILARNLENDELIEMLLHQSNEKVVELNKLLKYMNEVEQSTDASGKRYRKIDLK